MNDSTKIVNDLKEMLGKEDTRQTLVYLPIEKLFPHPDNPRKDLGDLTELTESIAKNGVMQNLTVIPNLDDTNDYNRMLDGKNDGPVEYSEAYRDHAIVHCFKKDYTIVIGHRRHAAAVQAGLKELPCVIADLDYPTQIATMLTENLQRADLTVYEQAQSFKQLTISCGMSAASIAKKTGFSETTVRRRLKMAELDQDILKSVSGRQLNMADFEKLDKIEDPKLRNNALKEIGTRNFANAVLNAEAEEKKRAKTAEMERTCNAAGFEKIAESKGNKTDKYERIGSCLYNAPSEDKINEFLALNRKLYYYVDRWGYLYIVAERDAAQEQKKKDTQQNEKMEREKACKLLEEAFERAFKLRFNFIKEYSESEAKKHIHDIIQLGFDCAEGIDPGLFYKLIGFTEEELEDCADLPTWEDCAEKGVTTYRALLFHVYSTTEDDAKNKCYESYSWSANYGKYTKSERLTNLYTALERLGYEMSDEEKALMDGSSELYYGNEPKPREKRTRFEALKAMSESERAAYIGDADTESGAFVEAIKRSGTAEGLAEKTESFFCPAAIADGECFDKDEECSNCITKWLNETYEEDADND